jgi:hypothetical protein
VKYRKRPVVIEATQWFKVGDHPAVFEHTQGGHVWVNGVHYIETREGRHTVSPGDFIITGIMGEFYPCKPDIFALTYELVEDQS